MKVQISILERVRMAHRLLQKRGLIESREHGREGGDEGEDGVPHQLRLAQRVRTIGGAHRPVGQQPDITHAE